MAVPQRFTGPGSMTASAAPRPQSRKSGAQSYPLRQTAMISPIRPSSSNAYPHTVHTGSSVPGSTKPSPSVSGTSSYQSSVGRSHEPLNSGRSGQTQSRHVQPVTQAVTPQPRAAENGTHEGLFQEIQAYIDTQIDSVRSTNLVSPSSPQHVAEDFDSRLESAFKMIAEEQAQKFEELHGTLEQRMNSLIEHRIEQAMQDMNASNVQNFQQLHSTHYKEIDQRLAQAEMQASEEARAIAAQAIEECKSSMDAHVSRDVGMSQEAAALLRQQHDDFSAKLQHHDEHIAMFRQRHDEHAALFRQHQDDFSAKFQHHDEHTAMLRQRQDEHAAQLHQINRNCHELRENHAQNPAPTPNVTTDAFEQSIGTFREQITYDVQCMVEDLMKKLDHMTDNMTTERREREGNDNTLSERINALTANERNICARMDDLTMETKNMGETAMALTAQVNSTSERSLDRSFEHHHVADPRYDDIMNQVQNLHSRFSEMEPAQRSCSPLLGRVCAYEAQGLAAKVAVEQGNTNEIKSALVGVGCYAEGGGERETRNCNEVGASPVRSARGTNMSVVSEEKLRGLSEKSSSLLDRMHKVSQQRDLATVSSPVQSAQGVNLEKLRELSEKSSSLLDRMHKVSQHPSRSRDLAAASADSNCDGFKIASIPVRSAQWTNIPGVSEERLRRVSEKSSSLLDRMHKVSQHPSRMRDLATVSSPVQSARGVNLEKMRELSEKSSSLLDRMHTVSQHPFRQRDIAVASADSNGDDYVMSKIQVIQARAEKMEGRLNSLPGQSKLVPEEKLAELLARVDNLETATAQAYPEKLAELLFKSEELEKRLQSMEEEKEANLGWTDRQHILLKSSAEKLHERLQKIEGAVL